MRETGSCQSLDAIFERLTSRRMGALRSAVAQGIRGYRQLPGKRRIEDCRQGHMCGAPNRHCCFQASRPFLGEPHCSLPLITLHDGDFDQPITLQSMQVSGEGGLIKPQPSPVTCSQLLSTIKACLLERC